MKKFWLGLVFGATLWSASAQNYVPIDTLDALVRKQYVVEYEKIHKDFKTELEQKYSNPLRRVLLTTFDKVQTDFIKSIEAGDFSYDSRFLAKLEEISHNIQKDNPSLPKNLKMMLSKQGELNAYNLGEGTIVVNMGVFQYLDNEDQLAGIIGHEMAHQALNHVLQTQIRRFEMDKTKSKIAIKEVNKQRYNRGAKALGYYKEVLYAEGEDHRKQEMEADQMGYKLLENTKYQPQEILTAFQLIKQYDTLRFRGVHPDIYKQLFDFPEQPFQEKWLLKEDFSTYQDYSYIDKLDEKAILSHPELDDRILNLAAKHENSIKVTASAAFANLKSIAQREQVPNMYFNKEYGAAVYMSLLYIQQKKDVAYYKEWLGKVFAKIYEARKSYKLNRYLDTVTPKTQSESYQQFLSFMWNLNIQEVKNIADYYTVENVPTENRGN